MPIKVYFESFICLIISSSSSNSPKIIPFGYFLLSGWFSISRFAIKKIIEERKGLLFSYHSTDLLVQKGKTGIVWGGCWKWFQLVVTILPLTGKVASSIEESLSPEEKYGEGVDMKEDIYYPSIFSYFSRLPFSPLMYIRSMRQCYQTDVREVSIRVVASATSALPGNMDPLLRM